MVLHALVQENAGMAEVEEAVNPTGQEEQEGPEEIQAEVGAVEEAERVQEEQEVREQEEK